MGFVGFPIVNMLEYVIILPEPVRIMQAPVLA